MTRDTAARAGAIAARAGKFYFVGAAGMAVQLAALWLIRGLLDVPYLPATALAVETAVLHNFLWHERWTWADRAGSRWTRLARFHLGNGLLSLVGNVAMMKLLVGIFGMHYLAANVVAICVCALANFALAEWFVFRGSNNA